MSPRPSTCIMEPWRVLVAELFFEDPSKTKLQLPMLAEEQGIARLTLEQEEIANFAGIRHSKIF